MYVKTAGIAVRWSRRRTLFTILLTSFVVDTAAMFLLPLLLPSDVAPWIEALCDAVLLSLGSLPLLWFLLIRPLYATLRKLSHRSELFKAAVDEHTLVSITDTRGKIIYANDAFCRISKFTRAALLGKDHRVINSGHHPKSFMKGLWDTIKRGEIWHGELKNRASDGSFYWVQATIVPFTDVQGHIEQYVAIRTDISELKRVEQRIEQYGEELAGQKEELEAQHQEIMAINTSLEEACRKARDATRAKSEFLANMSHEIRTPMTAILGFAGNMLDADQPEPERWNCIHTIRRNGKYLLGLINDILDLSKIEAGKMTIERRNCQPCRIVAEVASLMRVRADAKGLPFNIEYIGAIPKTIQSDPTRLRQILINLIGNAIKFTAVGAVRLVTRFVPGQRNNPPCAANGERKDPLCDEEDKKNPCPSALQFDVIDTGRGMTEEQVAKLFHPFTQADTSMTRKFGGTGLGLTISQRFAQLLGGDITVAATAAGVGSTFRATVTTGPLDGVGMLDDPMSETVVADVADPIAPLSRTGLQGCRVLLGEDCPDNRRLISFILNKAGAAVTAKENGKLALDAALAARDEGNPFDCILMDMQMPVMDGYEAVGQLRRKSYTGPIIALTAHSMDGDREKCIRTGCDDYATKPIDRKKLIETIQQHWVRPEAASPAAM